VVFGKMVSSATNRGGELTATIAEPGHPDELRLRIVIGRLLLSFGRVKVIRAGRGQPSANQNPIPQRGSELQSFGPTSGDASHTAAIDSPNRRSNERRQIRREKDNDVSDFFRSTQTRQWQLTELHFMFHSFHEW